MLLSILLRSKSAYVTLKYKDYMFYFINNNRLTRIEQLSKVVSLILYTLTMK